MSKIIVVGNGLAGLSAAISAVENGSEVTLISYLSPDRSQSVLAAGGINAALDLNNENDSTQQHRDDTLKHGCYISNEQAVEELTGHAPELLEYLQNIGVVFTLTEDGRIAQRYFGGQKKKRTAYSGAGIGKQLISGLSSKLAGLEAAGNVTHIFFTEFISLIMNGNKAVGVYVRDTKSKDCRQIYGDAVVMATGGLGSFFEETTGSTLSSGIATAMLFYQGAELANLEMIQFHPTTAKCGNKSLLISEACRGEGGRLFVYKNGEKYYFMESMYGEGGNLMPRDIVSLCEDRAH